MAIRIVEVDHGAGPRNIPGVERNEAYPLSWPAGWPRRAADASERAKFNVKVSVEGQTWKRSNAVTLYVGRERLLDELRRLGATDVVLSSNIPTRLDGLPYSKAAEPRDHAVAVYFRIKHEPRVLACDKWDRVADNMAALAAHVEAIRGQLRWGVGSLEQAFGGYRALPAMGATKAWHEILGMPASSTWDQVKGRREYLLRQHHPDHGGNQNQAAEINAAFDEARVALGGR
jgi:hypothetical protein